MAKDDKRTEAEKLYVKEGMSCPQIAMAIGVNEGTVYRWKAEAAEKGESADWDTARRVYNMSPRELVGIYAEALKNWMVQIKRNPDLLADGKIADAIVKHVSVLQKLDTRSQYLGAIADLIEMANKWLAENQPELKTKMEPYWEGIYQYLKEYSSMKGLF
jgi:transposase-like protein